MKLTKLTIAELARLIRIEWSVQGNGIPESARPSLMKLFKIDTINQSYENQTGKEIVSNFLNNSKEFKGKLANQIKSELANRVSKCN